MMSLSKFLTFFPLILGCGLEHYSWTKLLCYFCKSRVRILVRKSKVRYVTQISASPHPISLSQTNHYSFSFLGFQIAILNSPTQFLSLTLFSSRDLSLGCAERVCVFMVVWLWVWVLLFLWVCGHVCM